MALIPQSFIDDLLNRIDIVDVVDHRVKLKRSGKNYSACCPFHEEKTPSFTVSPDKQFYYCFGCGATGNAIGFVMEYDRSNFVDAVEALAKSAGVEVPREETPYDNKREQHRKHCYEILARAQNLYTDNLKSHPQRRHAVKYLQNRGLSGHIAKTYAMGYAAPGWDNLLLALGQNETNILQLVDSGLVIEKPEENKRYDRFRHRIMFPIRDIRGRTIGFGGRVLGDDKPKYLNSPETEVFSKGKELYGLYEAKQNSRKLEQLIVVEGYMDVIALAQYGLSNAVATLGTACGEDHLALAFKHVSEVIFCFDGDNAGRNAAKRALVNSLSSMQDGRQIRFLFLPEGQDPDSLVRQIGADRFKAQLAQATPLEDFLFDAAAEGSDLTTMDGRAKFSKTAAPMIHQLPDGVYKSLMFDNLAKRTGLSLDILSEFTKLPEDIAPEPPRTANESTEPESSDIPPNPALPTIPRRPDAQATRQGLPPARRAMILLLDQPELLNQCDIALEALDAEATDPKDGAEAPADQQARATASTDRDIAHLRDLIKYLKQRPQANFNNIIGYWGGSKGVEAQQVLVNLVANHVFQSLKTITGYDALAEFSACIEELNAKARKKSSKDELAELSQKGLGKLSPEEKQRYLSLIKSS